MRQRSGHGWPRRGAWRLPAGILSVGLLVGCVTPSAQTSTRTPAPRRTAPSLGPTDPPRPTPTAASLQTGTPRPTLAPIPLVATGEHQRGPREAAVTLVVYSDFQCLACAQLASVLSRLQTLHPQDLRLVFRHFPLLEQHDKASLAGQLAEQAAAQGAFWTVHDLLFQQRSEWVNLAPEDFMVWAAEQAQVVGLDDQAIQSALADGRYADRMVEAYREGLAMGIPTAPFLLLDGEPYMLPPELNYLEAAVRLQLLSARQFSDYPTFDIDLGREYLATLKLNRGEVVLQLYPQLAPLAVNSFVFLARQGWYDGNDLYQVQPGVFVESGDPTGTGLGDPGYHFAMEPSPSLRFDEPGMAALVPTSPETNGGRFFISLAPLPQLNGARTIFGRVMQGLELLRDLPARDPLLNLLDPSDGVLEGIEIEEHP